MAGKSAYRHKHKHEPKANLLLLDEVRQRVELCIHKMALPRQGVDFFVHSREHMAGHLLRVNLVMREMAGD